MDGSFVAIRTSRESGEDDEDERGDNHACFSGLMIGDPAEDEHADHSSRKGDRGNVLGGGGRGVLGCIEATEDCVYCADDAVEIAWVYGLARCSPVRLSFLCDCQPGWVRWGGEYTIRKQPGPTSHDGPYPIPS